MCWYLGFRGQFRPGYRCLSSPGSTYHSTILAGKANSVAKPHFHEDGVIYFPRYIMLYHSFLGPVHSIIRDIFKIYIASFHFLGLACSAADKIRFRKQRAKQKAGIDIGISPPLSFSPLHPHPFFLSLCNHGNYQCNGEKKDALVIGSKSKWKQQEA